MSVTIRLDRQAVAGLIEQDQDFKLDVQRSVVSEVLRKFVDKDFMRIVAESHKDLMKEALDAVALSTEFGQRVTAALNARIAVKPPGYAYTFKMTPDFQKMVDDEVKRQLDLALTAQVRARVDEAMASITNERIDQLVAYRINVDTAKVINQKVEERMTAILAAAKGA